MNASESVYQGRENTGLAQVLNWHDPKPVNIPWQAVQQLQYRQDQLRRQRRIDDDKAISDWMQVGKGHEYFNPTHERSLSTIQDKAFDMVHNQGLSADEAKMQLRGDHNKLALEIKKGLSAANTNQMIKGELAKQQYVDMRRSDQFVNDYTLPDKENGFVNDFNAIDENKAKLAGIYYGNHDAEGHVIGSASKIKNQITNGELNLDQFKGNNGSFFTYEKGAYKLRPETDPSLVKQGFTIDHDLVNHYTTIPEVYNRIVWDKAAQDLHNEGVIQHEGSTTRFTPQDRNLIDQRIHQDQQNPEAFHKKYDFTVRKTVNDWLENNVQTHYTDQKAVNAGRDFNPNGNGYGATTIQSNIQKDPNLFQYNNLAETEKQGGVSSHGDGSVPFNSDKMSRLEGVYPGKLATFTGTRIDPKTGKAVANFTDQQGYPLPPLELTQDMRARLNNVAKSKGEGESISKVLSETDKIEKQGGKMYVDKSLLDEKTKDFEKLLFNKAEANDNKEGYVAGVKKFLGENGIDAEVEVDRNYGAQWIKGGPFVKIKDQKFDLSNDEDKKKIKEVLFNSNPSRFSTREKGKTETQVAPEDFNTKWATIKSGEALVGPDGKTYTKK